MKVPETTVEKLYEALELFRVAIRGANSRKELPLQMLATFLTVAKRDGITMTEAAKEMDVVQSTISRNVKDMDIYIERDPNGNAIQKGCALVFRAPNEFNRREYSVFLSNDGKRLVKELEKVLG